MKKILFILLWAGSVVSYAQTKIEKKIPVIAGQKLALSFDYPELIKVQSWDKNEILIRAVVSINKGEHDKAFELKIDQGANEINVTSLLKDKENIPKRIVIRKGDTEHVFKASSANDPEVQKFLEENGREYNSMTIGISQEIELEIFVPMNMVTTVEAKYGIVEVRNFNAPLTVNAPYGGVDAAIGNKGVGELTARTRYGEILSNLDVRFNNSMETGGYDKWTTVSSKIGNGPGYNLESKYGKVYLRKATN